MKAHTQTKRGQFTEIIRIKNNLNEDEILVRLGHSKNYKCKIKTRFKNIFIGSTHYRMRILKNYPVR